MDCLDYSPAQLVPTGERLRIVIIEDNQDAADSLRMLLELLGHEVRVAYSGPEGVRLAKEWAPTVVLSDIGLPGLDGFGVARALRHDEATANAQLIAITAYSDEANRRRAEESGFDHFLTKPMNSDTLQRLLSQN